MNVKLSIMQLNKSSRILSVFLFYIFIFQLVMYFFFMMNTAFLASESNSAYNTNIVLSDVISELETTYIKITNRIDIGLAYKMGFMDVKNPSYIYRNEQITALFLDINEL